MKIRADPKIGYEIDASAVPELNRRLTDKILLALNSARASEEREIAKLLEEALALAEAKRQKRIDQHNAIKDAARSKPPVTLQS